MYIVYISYICMLFSKHIYIYVKIKTKGDHCINFGTTAGVLKLEVLVEESDLFGFSTLGSSFNSWKQLQLLEAASTLGCSFNSWKQPL